MSAQHRPPNGASALINWLQRFSDRNQVQVEPVPQTSPSNAPALAWSQRVFELTITSQHSGFPTKYSSACSPIPPPFDWSRFTAFDHHHGLITDTRYFSRTYETRRACLHSAMPFRETEVSPVGVGTRPILVRSFARTRTRMSWDGERDVSGTVQDIDCEALVGRTCQVYIPVSHGLSRSRSNPSQEYYPCTCSARLFRHW